MAATDDRGGKSRMPPPLPCLIGVIAGLATDLIAPWPIMPYRYALVLGLALIAAVIALSVAMSREFKRHGTSPDPARETTAIVDTGPFRFTRNPAYVTVALLHLALGLLFNSVWIALTWLPAMLAIHHLVVLREEAYLRARFGAAYLAYTARVRRWL